MRKKPNVQAGVWLAKRFMKVKITGQASTNIPLGVPV